MERNSQTWQRGSDARVSKLFGDRSGEDGSGHGLDTIDPSAKRLSDKIGRPSLQCFRHLLRLPPVSSRCHARALNCSNKLQRSRGLTHAQQALPNVASKLSTFEHVQTCPGTTLHYHLRMVIPEHSFPRADRCENLEPLPETLGPRGFEV